MISKTGQGRPLSVPGLLGLVIFYLVVIQGLGLVLTSGQEHDYGELPTIESIFRGVLIPATIASLLVVAVISWLDWWDQVIFEALRLRRWAWWFPALMVISMVIVTDYTLLGDVGIAMTLALAITALIVGTGEELMFRGITLEAMRRVKGTTELKAAMWTAAIFGAAHITNIVTEGSGAFVQAALVAVAGLYFYIARRVSGGILIPILLHAGWDFSLLSGNLGLDPEPHTIAIVAVVTNLLLAIVLVVRRHEIWPRVHAG